MFGMSQKEKNAQLSSAFWREDPDRIEAALKKGAQVDERLADGEFPVIWAANYYSESTGMSVMQMLIDAGADLDKRSGDTTALSQAIRRGRVSLYKMLADAGVDLNGPTGGYDNATKYAIVQGNWLIVADLLDRGVAQQAYPATEDGVTLLLALTEKNAPLSLVSRILSDEDVNRLHKGKTPLSVAALNGREDLLDLFLARPGAKIDLELRSGRGLLQSVIEKGNSGAAKKLIGHGADIFRVYADGKSALQVAAEKGDAETLQAIIDKAQEKGRTSDLGLDACLRVAAESGQAAAISALVKAGANPEAADEDGQTPVIKAALNGRFKALKMLSVRHGADLLKGDKQGKTPLECARESKNAEVIAWLETKQPDYVPPPPPIDRDRFFMTSDTTLDVKEKNGLTMTFNFWTQQLIYREAKNTGPMVVQNFADVQRREAIDEAYDILKRLGGNPPEPEFNRTADKPAQLRIK
ncbi:MAG: hypothetical protein GC185_06075 [Alphaproteobacteria bacterium]|nr:hypothetical protein [Alphaproteobacteria bacterium]